MMTLGWVGVLPDGNKPLMLNKTGGLQGQFSSVVIAPSRGVGVFVSINQFSVGGFNGMVEAANNLVAQLAPRKNDNDSHWLFLWNRSGT